MARTKTKYNAQFIKNDEIINTNVIMTTLPYDDFGPDNPLYIHDDVDMGKGKKAPLPDFTDVIIEGTFDCSDFTITESCVLPLGITELTCLHSINSLEVLINKIPRSVHTVIVRPAILNNIKKNLDENRATVQQFMAIYPNIIVTDGKQTLAQIMTPKEIQPVKPAVTQLKKDPEVPAKTDEWLSGDEMAAVCMDLSETIASLTNTEVARYVQMARSPKAKLGIQTQKMKRTDGEIVTCINHSEVLKVIEFIENKIAEVQTPKAKTTKKETKETEANQKPKQVSNTDSAFFDTVELKIVKIDKYITKRVWKKIQSKCSDNVGAMLYILRNIEAINVNQAQIKTNGRSRNAVYIDENGKTQTSTTIETKFPFLTQSFGTLDDRTRIVWVAYGNKFVAQHFLTDHTDPKSHALYKKILANKDIDLSDFDWDEQLKVTDLIKKLDDGPTPPPPSDPTTETVDTAKIEETADTEPVQETMPATEETLDTMVSDTTTKSIAETVGTPVINATDTVTPVATDNATDSIAQKTITEKSAHSTRNIAAHKNTWKQLYSMHAEFHTTIQNINLRQKEIAEALLVEETETSIKMTEELQGLLKKKQAYEEALKRFREAAIYMQEIQQQYK